jgi:hypothetical protein
MSEVKDKELLLAKIKLLAIIGIFGLPLLAAIVMSFVYKDGMPLSVGTSNKGDLIQPVQALPEFELTSPREKVVTKADFNELWTLVYISENGCDKTCQHQVYAIRQLNQMIGKEAERVQRLFIYGGLIPAEEQSVSESFPRMLMGTTNTDSLQQLATTLRQPGHDSVNRIYLVDPIGQAMMSFSADLDPRAIYKDLKHLLKMTKG